MRRTLLAAALLVALSSATAVTSSSQSSAFTYQGELSASGQPANGTFDMTFALFDAASGGNQVGATVSANQYPVSNGLFTIDLDFPGAFHGQQLWIEATIGGQTLTPRQPVNAVPVAQYALTGNIGPAGATGATGPTGPTGAAGTAPTVQAANYNANGSLSVTDSAANTVTTPNAAWTTSGNSGTVAGTNFIGTTDAQALAIKTNGNAANRERMRFLTTPQVLVNATAPQAGDLFAVYGTGATGATNGVANQTDFPINGYSTGAFGGIYGENTGTGQGVFGQNTATGVGLYGANSASGYGVFGTSSSGNGVGGFASSASSAGVRAANQNASGTGLLALGNNLASGNLFASGSGVATNGTVAGTYSVATNTATGIGVIAGGNGIVNVTLASQGAGVDANGEFFGVVGYAGSAATPLTNNKWGGYFDYPSSINGYAYVGGRTGGVDYAILSGGVKSTMVRGLQGESRVLFATEAPEVLFSDYGSGELADGVAHVALDPLLSNAIAVDATHPLRVFVQVEGECNGVYVTNKSASGFDVHELGGGHSNTAFSWQVVASRADTLDAANNVTSRFSQVRFPVGPARAAGVPAQITAAPAQAAPVPAKARRP